MTRVRNLAANTQRPYLQQVSNFAQYFGRSPALLGPEEIRAYQLRLAEVQRRSRSTLVVATAALRFLYSVTLKRDWPIDEIPMSKVPPLEFIRRFLLHILPRGLQRIRHYGLLSNRLRESRLTACRHRLNVEPDREARTAPEPDYRDRYAKLTGRSLYDCPVCSRGRMLCIERLLPGASPRAPLASPR
jgi:hypothetical protein